MPKIHRHRGVTTEVTVPTDPSVPVVLAEPVVEPAADPVEPLEAVIVDEHGDDAAAVEGVSVLVGEPGPELEIPPAAGVVVDTPPVAPAAPASGRRASKRP